MKGQLIGLMAFVMLLVGMQFAVAYDFDQPPTQEEQHTFDQILTPVMKIYNLVKYVSTIIAALALLFAGIVYMMSGSDPKKRDTAKGMATYVLIGLAIIWAAPLLVNLVAG